MTWLKDKYDAVDTETFDFFGRPSIRQRLSPVACFFNDVKNVFVRWKFISVVLAVFYTNRPIDELYLWAPTVFSLIGFSILSLFQAPGILIVLIFTTFTTAILSGLTYVHSVIWRGIQGPQLQVYPPTPPRGYNPRHRWIYINGIATGKTITRQNLECLAETFHNPVLAINNRTYGFLADLLECVIQRAFGFRTVETGIATEIVKKYLTDHSNVDKVILIAHSQGGIIASHILDDLYCELSTDELCKLEVYTFGSAALTFRNPFADKSHRRRVIEVMEHYCNERDMVTTWGALSSADREEVPFVGRVFVNHDQTGHMLNQHYLRYMFPLRAEGQSLPIDHYLQRAVRPDPQTPDKFHVESYMANRAAGQPSVQSLSQLWKHL